MNIPADIAKTTIESLRSTPVILGLLLLNVIMLAGFAFTLSQIASGLERRDAMIKACIERAT